MSRGTTFVGLLVVGLVLAVGGFALSAPIGPTEGPFYSNPRLDFAPLVFVIGIILMFLSAVAYELAGATESVTADAAVALLDLDPEDDASPQLAP